MANPVMRPNDQAEHTDTRHGVDHPDRAKHGLTRKGGDHVADQTKARQDEDVNLGVAKKPEQVHIEHRVATTPWVESGGVSVAIGEEHRESTRKHGQGEQEQKVGDEHAPHKQGNSLHRQCQCLALIDLGLKFTL